MASWRNERFVDEVRYVKVQGIRLYLVWRGEERRGWGGGGGGMGGGAEETSLTTEGLVVDIGGYNCLGCFSSVRKPRSHVRCCYGMRNIPDKYI